MDGHDPKCANLRALPWNRRKNRISAGKMLHDSKFAPKIGIVQQNSSVPSVAPYSWQVPAAWYPPWAWCSDGGARGSVACAGSADRDRGGGLAFENGWIMRDQLTDSAERYGKRPYGQHLKGIADGEIMLVPNQKS